MPIGTPVSRHFVVILIDGRVAVDWGNSLFQDVLTGEFLSCTEQEISTLAQNEDLEALKSSGCVVSYDPFLVYFSTLPEQPHRTLD